MQKELVIQKLKERGCRITKQRQVLLDVILQEDCASCKEIYYKAVSRDESIGVATVYRMVNLLEKIGAISRKNMYRIFCCMNCEKEDACTIELDDHTVCQLSAQNWYRVVSEGRFYSTLLPLAVSLKRNPRISAAFRHIIILPKKISK